MPAQINVKVTTEVELTVSERTRAALIALGWKPPTDHGAHMTPSLGRIVLANVDPAQNNGSDTAPAVITRVWNEQPDGRWIVNVRVLVDSDAVPLFLSSVYLHDQEPEERGHSVWWPPRV